MVAFGIHKIEISSIQYLPKLFASNEIISAIKDNENFIYLGRSFNFKMDNNIDYLRMDWKQGHVTCGNRLEIERGLTSCRFASCRSDVSFAGNFFGLGSGRSESQKVL